MVNNNFKCKIKLFTQKNLFDLIVFIGSIFFFIIMTKYFVNLDSDSFLKLIFNAFSLKSETTNPITYLIIYSILFFTSLYIWNITKFKIKDKIIFLLLWFIITPLLNALFYYSCEKIGGGLSLLIYFLFSFNILTLLIILFRKLLKSKHSGFNLLIIFILLGINFLLFNHFLDLNSLPHLLGLIMGFVAFLLFFKNDD